MREEILKKYEDLHKQYQAKAEKRKKKLRMLSLARLVSFVSIFPVIIILSPPNPALAIGIVVFLLVIFLMLVKQFLEAEKQLLYFQNLAKINQDEIRALNYDFSVFDPGSEFTDHQHDYSFDLDLYGIPSFFQFLNRTVTSQGKKHLSSALNKSFRPKEEIINKQKAIQELAEQLDWRQHFMAIGKESKNTDDQTPIDDVIGQTIPLKHEKATQFLPLISPIILVICTILYLTNVLTEQIFLIVFLAQFIIYIFYAQTISKFNNLFQSQGKLLRRFVKMLRHVEKLENNSDYIRNLKLRLAEKDKTASEITTELQRILDQFDYRQNIFVAFILNFIMLWDIRCVAKLYRWQQKYSAKLPKWFEVIAEMDALTSLANCNYNHPDWISPEVVDSGFHFKAENMGHPLIPEERCVRNSFRIEGEEKIVIVTGANMAGKSTFLRTVGINLILASNGCKVCATDFKFSPVRIYTNMRTTDNLMKDESYFYAELLRLQSMLQLLRNGENLFVIVDEMLKGTNSVDKLNGSKELIHQLISLKTHGIVATHDLGLTELAENYPKDLKNQCFEVQLNDNDLSFSYKLTNGVTKTMNATFLMKKMGIIPKEQRQ